MMGWYGGGMGPLGWLAMVVFWLILLGLIVWLVVRLVPGSDSVTTRPSGESPLENPRPQTGKGRGGPGDLAGPKGRPDCRQEERDLRA